MTYIFVELYYFIAKLIYKSVSKYHRDSMELSNTDKERCDRAISIARRSEVAREWAV